jgi:hypothetical protein
MQAQSGEQYYNLSISHNMSACLNLLRMYASPEWRAKLQAQSGTIYLQAQSGELTESKPGSGPLPAQSGELVIGPERHQDSGQPRAAS